MHPNPVYHDADQAQNLGFARDRAFGVLAVAGGDVPMLAHVPFLLSDSGAVADHTDDGTGHCFCLGLLANLFESGTQLEYSARLLAWISCCSNRSIFFVVASR